MGKNKICKPFGIQMVKRDIPHTSKDGIENGIRTKWYKNGKKGYTKHFKNGIENGIRTEWDEDGKLTYEGNFVDGNEE
jgi:antitoxin component YwqK of YwqJK toxin-antitoxin module